MEVVTAEASKKWSSRTAAAGNNAAVAQPSSLEETTAGATEVRLLSDAPPPPLADVASLLGRAAVILGVHGAGWANLIFAPPGAHAVELALPEPHAIYAAHTASALGMTYHLVPLARAASYPSPKPPLHSAREVSVPVAAVSRTLKRALRLHYGVTGRSAEGGPRLGVSVKRPLLNATPHLATAPRALRQQGSPQPSVEVVVARYRENASWAIRFNSTVYNKGGDAPAWAASFRRWIPLPNVGRESHTIVSHIVSRYDSLADWTVFMQGDPFDHLPAGLSVDTFTAAATDSRETFFPLTAVVANPASPSRGPAQHQRQLRGLGFRSGYAPYAPFTGELMGPPGAWAQQNRDRLPLLLQPLGLWAGEGEHETSWPSSRGASHLPNPSSSSSASPRSTSSSAQGPGEEHIGGPPPHRVEGPPFVNRTALALPLHTIDVKNLKVLPIELDWIEARRATQGDPGLAHFWRRFIGSESPPTRLYHSQGAQFGVSARAVRRRPKAWYEMLRDELARGGVDPVASYYCELAWFYVFDTELAPATARW